MKYNEKTCKQVIEIIESKEISSGKVSIETMTGLSLNDAITGKMIDVTKFVLTDPENADVEY